MLVRLRSLRRTVLETFADARHPRFAIAMICLTGFLAGSLTTAALLLPQYAFIVACVAPLGAVSLGFAIWEWHRPGSSGGRGDDGHPHHGPRPHGPDRWRCPWYDTLWTDQLPDEPSPRGRRSPLATR